MRQKICLIGYVCRRFRGSAMRRDSDYNTAIIQQLQMFHPIDPHLWFDEYMRAYRRHENGAPRRRVQWSLSIDEFWRIVMRARGCCELTGTPFNFYYRAPTTNTRPFIPSLDRINSTMGYNICNARLIVSICNQAMNEYGEVPLFEMVKHTMTSPLFNDYISRTEGYSATDNYGHNQWPDGVLPAARYIIEKNKYQTEDDGSK